MRRLWPLYVVIFMGFLGYSIQIPIFTSTMLDPSFNLTAAHWGPFLRRFLLGVLLGMYPFGQFLGAPILGAFSDRLGRRPVLLVSMILSIFFYFLLSAAIMMKSLWLLYVTLFATGLTEGNIAIAQGAIVDVTEDNTRSYYFGIIYVFSSSGYIFGPLLASVVSNTNLVSWFHPSTPFWVVGLLMIASTIWVVTSFKETRLKDGESRSGYFQEFTNLKEVFFDERLRYYYGINFILYLAIFGYFRVYAIYMVEEFKVDLTMLSLIVAYVSIPMIFMNVLITKRLAKRLSPKAITMVSAIVMGLSMIAIVVPNELESIWATLFITTCAVAATMTFSNAMISFMTDKAHQGRVMGNNQSIQAGAQGISSVVGGFLAAIAVHLPLIIFGLLGIFAGTLLVRNHLGSKT